MTIFRDHSNEIEVMRQELKRATKEISNLHRIIHEERITRRRSDIKLEELIIRMKENYSQSITDQEFIQIHGGVIVENIRYSSWNDYFRYKNFNDELKKLLKGMPRTIKLLQSTIHEYNACGTLEVIEIKETLEKMIKELSK